MYQEAMAFTGVTTTEALRAIAARIDTSGAEPLVEVDLPTAEPRGMGGGIGRGSVDGGISDYGYAGDTHEPTYVAFNLTAGSRKTVVRATVWDSPAREDSRYEAVFPDGTRVPCQLLETGNYWAHRYQTFAVPVAVDGYGYQSFRISPTDPSDDPMGEDSRESSSDVAVAGALEGGASSRSRKRNGAVAAVRQLGIHHVCSYALYERGPEGLGNEFLDVHIDTAHGGIRSLRHKATGVELVVNAESILEYVVERPRGMSAWQIEHHGASETPRVLNIRREAEGPYVSTIAVDVEVSASRFTIRYRLEATDPRLYIEISGIWFERGSRDTGTPTLRFALPLQLEGAVPTYEIPFGGISRAMEHGEDVPALRWADVVGAAEGRTLGVLLVNDSKHGHSYHEDVLRVTLLRSSFSPDPLPEVDEHNVLLAVEPHESRLSVAAASSIATEVTEPVVLIQTDSHPGDLAAAGSFLQVAGGAVVSGVKMAESGEGIVVRLYNPADNEITADVSFGGAASREITTVGAVDLLERPVDGEGITVSAGTVSVAIGARAIRTLVLS
jgi:alpha-mannosidase